VSDGAGKRRGIDVGSCKKKIAGKLLSNGIGQMEEERIHTPGLDLSTMLAGATRDDGTEPRSGLEKE